MITKTKVLAIAIFALFSSYASIAQMGTDDFTYSNYRYGERYEGYVVTTAGDTLKGFIEYRNETENQEKCLFYDNPTSLKPTQKYTPKDLKAWSVADKFYTTAAHGLITKEKNFILVVSLGHIRKMKWYWYDDQKFPKELKTDDLLQKGDEKPVSPAKFIMFAKNMSEFVSDDAELSTKVKNKEKGYGLIHMEDILKEYNDWWAANHKK